YLIQEYEPFTFPMGTYSALAAESYRHRHFAVFSSELLRGYFRAHGVGVYGEGARVGDRESVAFENAITRVQPVGEHELAARATRRLLFYARPEPHAALLRDHDVGLALMYTPHPSLVPLEMASAGMLTVTNSFENKTEAALAMISSNLLTVEPTVDGIAAGPRAAAAAAGDSARRLTGAEVNWSTRWEQSFPDELLDRVIAAGRLT